MPSSGLSCFDKRAFLFRMPIDHHYHRDTRLIVRISVVLGVAVAMLAIVLSQSLSHAPEKVSPEEVWAYIQELAPQEGMDPEFVYALVWAESSLNARARSSSARGMMQLTRTAWREVTDESYHQAWDWRTNIRVGILYLDFCRDFLLRKGEFSYPLLAACFRYGPYYVQDKDFTIGQMQQPENEIYKRIFSGNVHPVELPVETASPGLE